MKALSVLLLLLICVAIEGCGFSRPLDEGYSIFPDPGRHLGRTVHIVTSDTPYRVVEAWLESIADESEASYRSRYEIFAADSSNRDIVIGLGSKITIITWPSGPTYYGEFLGYSPEGVLTSDSAGTHRYPFWEIDTLTKIVTGKTLVREELNDLATSNAIPMRGLFYFDGYGGYRGVTNSTFVRAMVVPPTQEQDAANNDGSVGNAVINGLFDILFSGSSDTDKEEKKKEEPKDEKDDAEKKTKKGRVPGEDRIKK